MGKDACIISARQPYKGDIIVGMLVYSVSGADGCDSARLVDVSDDPRGR